jgi:hypothetical protein
MPRIEIVGDRHRAHSAESRAAMVAQSLVPGIRIQDLARRNGICASLIYRWRREQPVSAAPVQLVPVRIVSEGPPPSGTTWVITARPLARWLEKRGRLSRRQTPDPGPTISLAGERLDQLADPRQGPQIGAVSLRQRAAFNAGVRLFSSFVFSRAAGRFAAHCAGGQPRVRAPTASPTPGLRSAGAPRLPAALHVAVVCRPQRAVSPTPIDPTASTCRCSHCHNRSDQMLFVVRLSTLNYTGTVTPG